jgi:hypothetical protein
VRQFAADLFEQLSFVVLTQHRHDAFAECIQQPHGVSFAGELADVGFVGPVEGDYLVVDDKLAAGDLAAEDQGDDAEVSTVAKAYRLLKAIFNTAVDDGLIRRKPVPDQGR